jgi:hypothetical protein
LFSCREPHQQIVQTNFFEYFPVLDGKFQSYASLKLSKKIPTQVGRGVEAGSPCTVPKTKQISENIGEEVFWRENFPIIRGNYAQFPRITGKFFLVQTFSPIFSEICLVFGSVWPGIPGNPFSSVELMFSVAL